jgi:hypothetical protein
LSRLNKRALGRPMRLHMNREEQLEVIVNTYDVWFKIWRETYVLKLMHQPIWIKSNRDLVIRDMVYFMKRESVGGDAKWTRAWWRASTEAGMASCMRQ